MTPGGLVYHVLNWSVAGLPLFRKQADYEAFERRLQGMLSDWPMERPGDWVRLVNQPMTEKEVERIRTCIASRRPYGSEEWQNRQAEDLGWWDTLRRERRPSKETAK